jgi:hypothetical protein
MNILNLFKKKKQVDQTETFTNSCHICKQRFNIDEKKIFPIQVQLMYKNEYITGKGYECPNCKNKIKIG